MEFDVRSSKSGHPIEGCTLGGAFIWFGQEMQEFGTLGMQSTTSYLLTMLSRVYV